jgi:hypothetical protein
VRCELQTYHLCNAVLDLCSSNLTSLPVCYWNQFFQNTNTTLRVPYLNPTNASSSTTRQKPVQQSSDGPLLCPLLPLQGIPPPGCIPGSVRPA